MIRFYNNSVFNGNNVLPLNLLKSGVYHRSRQLNSFLPAFIRYYDMENNVIICERAPEKQIISFDGDIFNLQLPWTLYFIKLNQLECHVAFNDSPLMSLDDEIYAVPLPNIDINGKVCLLTGEGKVDIDKKDHYKDLLWVKSKIISIFSFIWESAFTAKLDLEVERLPSLLSEETVKQIMTAPAKFLRWHAWLEYWQQNLDLKDVLAWNCMVKSSPRNILPKPVEITDDMDNSAIEEVFFNFFAALGKSLG